MRMYNCLQTGIYVPPDRDITPGDLDRVWNPPAKPFEMPDNIPSIPAIIQKREEEQRRKEENNRIPLEIPVPYDRPEQDEKEPKTVIIQM
jgi:hypothetical protein